MKRFFMYFCYLMILSFLFCLRAWADFSQGVNDPRVVLENNLSLKSLEKKKTAEARQYLLDALSKAPENEALHLNLGLQWEVQEENEKALKEYQFVYDSAQNPEIKFLAAFNTAVALGKMKKVEEALHYYQLALDIHPESPEVKTNIEMLTQSQSGGQGENQQQDKNSQGNQDQKDKNQNEDNKDKKGQKPQEQKDKGKNKDKKDDQNKDKNKQPEKQKQQPRPFKSKDLTKEDVRKILEELKRQEQQIRSKVNNKARKERPNDKDW